MCFYNCHIEGLNLPLMVLVDYRGYRVVALSVLLISASTLVCCSDDVGETVKSTDPQMNEMMERAGNLLNLAKHEAGKKRVNLYGPVDIEGHLGTVKPNQS